VIILFAHEILQAWLGAEFAAKGTLVLQILAVGLLANSLAFVPFGLLQAVGRPDWTAKFHFIELPLYAALLWLLLKRMGVTGAATAWTIRVSLDACLLFAASLWSRCISLKGFLSGGLVKTTVTIGLFGILLGVVGLCASVVWMKGMFAFVLLLAFALAAWQYLLDASDRDALLSVAGRLSANLARAR
jgi:O-antigen/teichoic acid export membrane protein